MPHLMSPAQTEKLQVEINTSLKKGFIERSQKPMVVTIHFSIESRQHHLLLHRF